MRVTVSLPALRTDATMPPQKRIANWRPSEGFFSPIQNRTGQYSDQAWRREETLQMAQVVA